MFLMKKNAPGYVYEDMYTIGMLKEKKISSDIHIDRSNLKICVLDDEGFDINKIYALGYKQVERKLRFENIEDYEKYDIILCDIEGIGNEFDPTHQGLAVAEQIKDQYPEKIVLIYSGKNVEAYGELPPNIDGALNKVESTTELVKSIEKYYKESMDPYIVWEKTRQRMLDSGISTKTVAVIEDRFCKSILEKEDYLKFEQYTFIEVFQNIEKYILLLRKVVDMIKGV